MKKHHLCLWVTSLVVFFTILVKSGNLGILPEDVIPKEVILIKNTNHSSPSSATTASQPHAHASSPAASPPSAAATAAPHTKIKKPARNPTPSPMSKPAATTQPYIPFGKNPITYNKTRNSNQDLTQQEQAFLEKYCDLQPSASWYPTGDLEWQQQAPYVILPGSKHSGTTSLYQALLTHPAFRPPPRAKELGFFLPRTFNNYVSRLDKRKVFAARQRMYARDYTTQPLKQDSGLKSMDATSSYLYHSDQIPRHILCVAPWSKLVILLRNPVERVYSHWAHGKAFLGLKVSFEDWIAQEIETMQRVGLVPAPTSLEEEDEAWSKYQALRASEGAIGRSMYVIQLRHWLAAYKEAGKTPAQEMLLMASESLFEHPSEEYANVLKFLGLPDQSAPSPFPYAHQSKQEQVPIKEDTRKMLQEFFAPYNQRLFDLLAENGFQGNWKAYWTATTHFSKS
jgi:hypothetical protein